MDMKRVSTCSIALIHHPYAEAFRIIRDAGYKKVDILERVPHLSLFPEECDPVDLKAAAEAVGLKIANLSTYVGGGNESRMAQWQYHGWTVPKPDQFTGCGFSSDVLADQEKELEQVKRSIDLAVLLGARSMRIAAGDDDPKSLDKVVHWLKECADYAAEKRIYMGMENHSKGTSGQPEVCVELAERVGSPYFGILYEPHNLVLHSGTDYREALKIMKDHVVHVHLKDGAFDHKGEHRFTNLGEGMIDFPWILEQLEGAGYEGDYALEFEIDGVAPETGVKDFYEAAKQF